MKFNDEQIDAINAVFSGPVLVTAGAGTGKTSVLISAATSLIRSDSLERVKGWQILVVTFTNKAANEIKSRIAGCGCQISDMRWVGTFHSVCLKILRKNADKLGIRSDFLIYGEEEQKKVLKGIVGEDLVSEDSVAETI